MTICCTFSVQTPSALKQKSVIKFAAHKQTEGGQQRDWAEVRGCGSVRYILSNKMMKKRVVFEPQSPLAKYVRPGLNIHEVQQIKAVFDLFDTNQTGRINPKDLKSALKEEGKEAMGTPLYQLVCDLDEEGKGWIDFDNFLFFLSRAVTGQESEEELSKLFALFDDQKTGFISISGLRRISKYLGMPFQQPDLQEMMRQADKDNDGFVSFEQFCQIITYKP